MKLFTSPGPNPRIVDIFLAEKGRDLDRVTIDIVGGENRQPDYLARNPAGQLPALETDQGLVIAEVPVICEYLEELFPEHPLIGATPVERAETRMWYRRIDLHVITPMVMGFRYGEGAAFFSPREPVFQDSSANMKTLAQIKLGWLNDLLEGRQWVCGDRFTLADIALFCFVEFGNNRGQPLNPEYSQIVSLIERTGKRPSAVTPT